MHQTRFKTRKICLSHNFVVHFHIAGGITTLHRTEIYNVLALISEKQAKNTYLFNTVFTKMSGTQVVPGAAHFINNVLLSACGRAAICLAAVFYAYVAFAPALPGGHAWNIFQMVGGLVHGVVQRKLSYGLGRAARFSLVAHVVLFLVQVFIFFVCHIYLKVK